MIVLVPIQSLITFCKKIREINSSSFVNGFHVFFKQPTQMTVNSPETKILSLAKYFVKSIKCSNLLLHKLISRFFWQNGQSEFENFVRRAENASFFVKILFFRQTI